MPNIGPLELAIVLIVALIVFGPKRLPELGRSMGRGMREFRSSIGGDHKDEMEDSPASAPVLEPPADTASSADEAAANRRD